MLATLDFRVTFEPDRNELRVRATLLPELLPVSGKGMSSLSSVPRRESNLRLTPEPGRSNPFERANVGPYWVRDWQGNEGK